MNPFPTRFRQQRSLFLSGSAYRISLLCAASLLLCSPLFAQAEPAPSTPPASSTENGTDTSTENSATSMASSDDYIQEASVYSRIGDYTKAVAVLTKAIEAQPDMAQLFFHRGRAYFQIAAAEEKIVACTRAISKDPNVAASFLHRGFAYYNIGNYTQAISDYTHALTKRADYAAAFIGRGLAFIANGKRKEGMADYERAFQIQPELRPARYNALYQVGFLAPMSGDDIRASHFPL